MSDIVSQCSKRYGTVDIRPAFTSLAVPCDYPKVYSLSTYACIHFDLHAEWMWLCSKSRFVILLGKQKGRRLLVKDDKK